jgi:hypothetical protein
VTAAFHVIPGTAPHSRVDRHEVTRRIRKAKRLAEVLAAHDATAEQAADLPQPGRAMCAALAGVQVPSERTWATTVALLRMWEVER